MAVEHLYRLDDVNTVAVSELLISGLSHHRIHMNRIHRFTIRMLIKHTADGSEHMMHRLSEVFPAVGCDEDELVVSYPFKLRVSVVGADSVLHCIDNRVASNVDIVWITSLSQEIGFRERCRRKVVLADDRHSFSVELFRVRRIDVVRS